MRKFICRRSCLITALVILAALLLKPLLSIVVANIKDSGDLKVLVVYNPESPGYQTSVANAYRSVLEEEGIPFKFVTPAALLARTCEKSILATRPAVIIPDGVAAFLPSDAALWLKDYLLFGGNVLLVYDGGTRNHAGAFLDQGLFTDLLGINYVTYKTLRANAYTRGSLRFTSAESSKFFQIPSGKTLINNALSGYEYGSLDYPIARNETLRSLDDTQLFAHTVAEDGTAYPGLVLRSCGQGQLLYINMPLGYLKAHTDDLPLRAVLRTFLFQMVRIPHLMNTPYGKGGLVINWHIDASIDWISIPYMERNGYLRKDIDYSLHITAGDFRDEPGDKLGFDAAGKGQPYVQDILKYGAIGSHGGWAHNWFGWELKAGRLSAEQEEEYIKKNTAALETITKYKIVEYSAPIGYHPQPITTQILERMGFNSYYYTGDSGSAPNRTFVDGLPVSEKVIAFPIVPCGKAASFLEMKQAGVSEKQATQWLRDMVDYVIDNRAVRLIYSHPYDIPLYPGPLLSLLDYAQAKTREKRLTLKPMSYFAAFMQRCLKTDCRFEVGGSDMSVTMRNKDGLEGITVALPKTRYTIQETTGLVIEQDNEYYYLTCTGNSCETRLKFVRPQ